MRSLAVLLVILLLVTPTVAAQQAAPPEGSEQAGTPGDVDPLFAPGSSEWMLAIGPSRAVQIFHSSAGHNYVLPTLSWGRILTRPRGPGALRGRFQWSFELVPLYRQYEPVTTYGLGFTPLHWRWNFVPHGRLAPFAELAGGVLWTRDPVPVGTTTSNFTAHAGAGLRYFVRPPHALVFAYRFHHISNGNRLDRNPGVNAHVVMVGWSLMRPVR